MTNSDTKGGYFMSPIMDHNDIMDLCQETGHRKERILPRFACLPSPSCTFKNQKVHDGLGYFVAYFFSNSMGLISFNVGCTLLALRIYSIMLNIASFLVL